MLERQSDSPAFRPFLKINGCDLCENWEWHANLHEIVRFVSRDESDRLHLVKEELDREREDGRHPLGHHAHHSRLIRAVGRQLSSPAYVSPRNGAGRTLFIASRMTMGRSQNSLPERSERR